MIQDPHLEATSLRRVPQQGVFFVWRRRRDSQGSALLCFAKPIMFGFAEWSSSLSLCFIKKINPTQHCGCIGFIWRRRRDSNLQSNPLAVPKIVCSLFTSHNFDRYANSHSLNPPLAAVVFLARAFVARVRVLVASRNKKDTQLGVFFCLTEVLRIVGHCAAMRGSLRSAAGAEHDQREYPAYLHQRKA